jgi:RNA polymerase sigma factor (sigma-70 family)
MRSVDRLKVMTWVGSEILPHEADLRVRLRRMLNAGDIEDVIQEAYFRISRLDDIGHIQSGRAYLFTTAKMLVLERIRRSRVVNIESVTEIDAIPAFAEDPSPERIAGGRRELARVRRIIDALPDRCRRIFEMRKIEGQSQREVAQAMGLPQHIVENEVAKGLKLILKAIAEGNQASENALKSLGNNGKVRDSRSDF